LKKYSAEVSPLVAALQIQNTGTIPVPAPATLEILKGVPVFGGGLDFEATTPTGAALIKTLVNEFTDIRKWL